MMTSNNLQHDNESTDNDSTHKEKKFIQLKERLDKKKISDDPTMMSKLMESITIGSTGKKSQLKQDSDSESSPLVSESDDTLTSKGSLRSISHYTAQQLRSLAQKYKIQVTHNKTGQKKYLKKTELYQELKNCIKKNSLES
jgi:hypothetical protein